MQIQKENTDMEELDSGEGLPLILVVDDDPTMLLLAKSGLEQGGFRVVTCQSGVEAIAQFVQLEPKAVVLDVMMPEINGFKVCEELRKVPGLGRVPIIMMTALDDAESIHQAYESGATDYAVKPINWSVQQYRLRAMIRAAEAETELGHSEAQFRQAQKMEVMGRMAGGVAHDFNNILTGMISYCDLAQMDIENSEAVISYLDEIKSAGLRAAELTRQLLAFSRKQKVKPRRLFLNHVVSGMGNMLGRLIKEHIELEIVLEDDLSWVRADTGQIEQVLMNLVVNASDAMPDGGRLTLTTDNVTLDRQVSHDGSHIPVGDYVMLSVKDTGCGMDELTAQRIFEPFFTTKDSGKGTGLGLSMVYGILNQCKAHAELNTALGRGAEFRIYFPRIEPGETHACENPKEIPRAKGSERILLVEDEEITRNAIARAMERSGYTVLPAKDGRHAIEVCMYSREPIDLLVTDVVMPRMGGQELALVCQRLHPEMKQILISGYSEPDRLPGQRAGPRGYRFMAKPFQMSQLLELVCEVLGTAGHMQPAASA